MTASPPPSTGKPTPSPPQSPGTRRGFLVEAWKLGGLEAWLSRWGSAPHPRSPPSPAGALRSRGRFAASPLHALFSGAALPPLLPLLHLLHLLNLLLRRLLARRRRACGCRGDWRLGSLEAWRLGFPCTLLYLSPACRAFCSRGRFAPSALHAPFSVLRSPFSGAAEPPLGPSCSSCQPRRAHLSHPPSAPIFVENTRPHSKTLCRKACIC